MVLCGFSAMTIMIFFTLNIMKNGICIGNYTNLAFNEQSTISSCLTSSRTKQKSKIFKYFQPVSFIIVANWGNYLHKQLKSTTNCHKYFKNVTIFIFNRPLFGLGHCKGTLCPRRSLRVQKPLRPMSKICSL